VLHATDRGCSHPGCEVSGYYCEVHHVTDYAKKAIIIAAKSAASSTSRGSSDTKIGQASAKPPLHSASFGLHACTQVFPFFKTVIRLPAKSADTDLTEESRTLSITFTRALSL
jgi:hypothetical protein